MNQNRIKDSFKDTSVTSAVRRIEFSHFHPSRGGQAGKRENKKIFKILLIL